MLGESSFFLEGEGVRPIVSIATSEIMSCKLARKHLVRLEQLMELLAQLNPSQEVRGSDMSLALSVAAAAKHLDHPQKPRM